MKKQKVVLFFILGLAFFLRFYRLTDIPPGFTDDEASIGYNAYSVLKTGKDEYGKFLPIAYYKSLGDYKLPVNMYLVALSEGVFGVNKFAVRFPAALLGSLSVFVVYFVVKELFVDRRRTQNLAQKNAEPLALLSSLLLAISPWHIFSNRLGYEINIANFLFLTAIFFLVKGLRDKKYLLFAFLFFILTLYTYHSYWIFVPAFLLMIFFIYKERFLKLEFKYKLKLTFLVFIFVLPLFLSLFNSEYMASRVRKNIFSQPNPLRSFVSNYLMNFSFLILFAPTGFDPRDVMPDRGLLYLFEFPLIFIGLLYLLKNKHPALKIILPWALAYPLSHSLTEFGTATRMFLLLPLPQILAGIGFYIIFKKQKILGLILSFVILIGLIKLIPDLFFYHPYAFSVQSQYGSQELYGYLKKEFGGNNQRVFIDNALMHYTKYAFYAKLDPVTFIRNRENYDRIGERKVILRDRNFIVIDSLPTKSLNNDDILAGRSESFSLETKAEKIVYYLSGQKYATIITGENYLEVLD